MDTQSKRTGRVGVTFGAFDLCHAGHMISFREAKEQCDYLIVGLQDDPSRDNGTNRAYRGKLKNKPVMSVEERLEILRGIRYIDEVFVYSTERDLLDWLRNNRYDVRIIGRDWKGKKYTGHDLPHEVYYNSRNHSYSTSELRERVYRAEKERLEAENRATELDLDRAIAALES